MPSRALALILCSAALSAGALDGTWTGVLETPRGGKKSAVLVLKVEGTKVTGEIGGTESELQPIVNGKLEGGTISFEFEIGGSTARGVLQLSDDELRGTATKSGETQAYKLDLRRKAK
jgi:hypothetical protein